MEGRDGEFFGARVSVSDGVAWRECWDGMRARGWQRVVHEGVGDVRGAEKFGQSGKVGTLGERDGGESKGM